MKIGTSKGTYSVGFFATVNDALSGLTDSDRVIIDSNVVRHWPLSLPRHSTAEVPAGEASKSLQEFARLQSWLAGSGANRKTRVWAVGGGVVGDLAGFVASTYLRGVDLVMVPTTLLSMVDSSVGGKVAVDIAEGKNLVGAFWPPVQVRISMQYLDTLPQREVLCGSAEVWKYAFALDPVLLESLERAPIGRNPALGDIVERCIELKAQIVQQDEFETTGLRALLNFGHTLGHAIEAAMEFQWTHGEAISVGMVLETKLAERIGACQGGTAERVRRGLESQGLPVHLPTTLTPDTLIEFAYRDKKRTSEGLAFSLLNGVGKCKLYEGVPESEVRSLLADS